MWAVGFDVNPSGSSGIQVFVLRVLGQIGSGSGGSAAVTVGRQTEDQKSTLPD